MSEIPAPPHAAARPEVPDNRSASASGEPARPGGPKEPARV
ncbi:hypothetical protein [Streptomyces sp. NPDC096068]